MAEAIVVFEGPRGTSHERALSLVKTITEIEALPMFSSRSILESVYAVPDLFGIIPVESSMDGLRISLLDEIAFDRTGVFACEEVVLAERIEGFTLENDRPIDTVISHPQIIELCQEFIHQNELRVCYVASTDMACAKVVAERVPSTMALAPSAVGERHGLGRFSGGIFGEPEVRTRYFLIGHDICKPTGQDRTMLLVMPSADQPGTLAMISRIFGEHGANMQSIISRPLADAVGRHAFYISCDGHLNSESVTGTINELLEAGAFVKPLGSYPEWLGPDVTSPFSMAPSDSLKDQKTAESVFPYPTLNRS